MPGILSLVPPVVWRLFAIGLVFLGAYGTGWFKGRASEAEKFESYKAQVKAAGDKQNELTQQIVNLYKQRQENANATAKSLADERDDAVARLRVAESAAARRRLVPASNAATGGSGRICYTADELDRRLGESVDRLSDRVIAIAQAGQAGVDVATVCRNSWR